MESCYVLEQRKQVYETSLIVPSLIINNNDPLVCLLLFCEALCATMSLYENIDWLNNTNNDDNINIIRTLFV